MANKEFVTLMRFNQYNRAVIYQTLLESSGIETVLIHDTMADVLPISDLSIGLCVASADAAQAREILNASFDKKEFQEEAKASKKEK